MKVVEFRSRLKADGSLEVPNDVAAQIPKDRTVQVVVLLPQGSEDAERRRLAAQQYPLGSSEAGDVCDAPAATPVPLSTVEVRPRASSGDLRIGMSTPEFVVGVDGCPGGWLAIQYCPRSKELLPVVHRSFSALLAAYFRAACIAVDIPIGLRVDGQARRCDVEARRILAPKRTSCVFPAPDRRWLGVTSYQTALTLARQHTGKGISRQAFGIYPKVLEVDAVMSSGLQERVVEVHPELCFWALAGQRAMAFAKRRPEGFQERRVLLSAAYQGTRVPSRDEARSFARPACPDDVLDALAACWTALRHATGRSERLPSSPQLDPKGLRMEMVY